MFVSGRVYVGIRRRPLPGSGGSLDFQIRGLRSGFFSLLRQSWKGAPNARTEAWGERQKVCRNAAGLKGMATSQPREKEEGRYR